MKTTLVRLFLLTSLIVLWGSSQLSAAGLTIPDNGSIATARGGASASGIHDPTAGFLNPSLLSRQSGLRFSYNHNLILSHIEFSRSSSIIPDPYPYDQDAETDVGTVGTGRSRNETPLFPINGSLAMSYQLESGTTLGLSIHGPNSGGASKYPVQGGQRYMMTEFSGLLGFVGASIAHGGDDWGIGTTLQVATMTNMNYKMVVDGTSVSTLSPNVSELDVEAEIDVSAPAEFTALIGAWYRISDHFELAASGRILPIEFNASGDVKVSNTPNSTRFPTNALVINDGKASFNFTLPQTARLGLRYIEEEKQGVELFDLELTVVYERWSEMDELEINLEGYVLALSADLQDIVISKKWRDTLSARLGGSWRLNSSVQLHSGVFIEQGAVPEQYAHIDFPSYDRFGGAMGLSYQMLPSVELVIGYLHILKHQVTVSEAQGKVFQQRPIKPCPEGCGMNDAGQSYSGVPANAGTHTVSFQSFTLGVNTRF